VTGNWRRLRKEDKNIISTIKLNKVGWRGNVAGTLYVRKYKEIGRKTWREQTI
jgi:hypothetical protein